MRLDIVMPAHNEEDRIGRTLSVYRDACPDPDIRFLVAMDDCRDRTAEVVEAHAREDDRVELFAYPKLGKGGVIAETSAAPTPTWSGSTTPTAQPRRRS